MLPAVSEKKAYVLTHSPTRKCLILYLFIISVSSFATFHFKDVFPCFLLLVLDIFTY